MCAVGHWWRVGQELVDFSGYQNRTRLEHTPIMGAQALVCPGYRAVGIVESRAWTRTQTAGLPPVEQRPVHRVLLPPVFPTREPARLPELQIQETEHILEVDPSPPMRRHDADDLRAPALPAAYTGPPPRRPQPPGAPIFRFRGRPPEPRLPTARTRHAGSAAPRQNPEQGCVVIPDSQDQTIYVLRHGLHGAPPRRHRITVAAAANIVNAAPITPTPGSSGSCRASWIGHKGRSKGSAAPLWVSNIRSCALTRHDALAS